LGSSRPAGHWVSRPASITRGCPDRHRLARCATPSLSGRSTLLATADRSRYGVRTTWRCGDGPGDCESSACSAERSRPTRAFCGGASGGGGVRTHGRGCTPSPVFKTMERGGRFGVCAAVVAIGVGVGDHRATGFWEGARRAEIRLAERIVDSRLRHSHHGGKGRQTRTATPFLAAQSGSSHGASVQAFSAGCHKYATTRRLRLVVWQVVPCPWRAGRRAMLDVGLRGVCLVAARSPPVIEAIPPPSSTPNMARSEISTPRFDECLGGQRRYAHLDAGA